MKKILVIESSPNGTFSMSKKVSETLLKKVTEKYNGEVSVRTRDLNTSPVPHLSGLTVQAMFTPPDTRPPELASAIELSDLLTDELLWADEIILSVPMWNFSLPSVVKAWIDHVSRAGRTFSFGPEGLVGLAKGKKVYLVIASGSVFSTGAFAPFDQLAPYVKTFFGFIGITDVSVIRVEGLNDPANKDAAVSKAELQITESLR